MHFGPILTDLELFRFQQKNFLESFEIFPIRHFVLVCLHILIDIVELYIKKLQLLTLSMSLKKTENIDFLIYGLKVRFEKLLF